MQTIAFKSIVYYRISFWWLKFNISHFLDENISLPLCFGWNGSCVYYVYMVFFLMMCHKVLILHKEIHNRGEPFIGYIGVNLLGVMAMMLPRDYKLTMYYLIKCFFAIYSFWANWVKAKKNLAPPFCNHNSLISYLERKLVIHIIILH